MRSIKSTKRVLSAILCTAMIFNPVQAACAADSGNSPETASQTDTAVKKHFYNGKVTLEKAPDKLIYFVGEELDFTGGKVSSKCNISDGSTVIERFEHESSDMDINDGIYIYDISGFDNTQPGTYTIKIGKVPEGEESPENLKNNVKEAEFTVTVVRDLSKIENPSVELVFKKAQRSNYDLEYFDDEERFKPYDNVKFTLHPYVYDLKEDKSINDFDVVSYEVSKGNKIKIDLPAEIFRKYNDPQRYNIGFYIDPVDLPEGFNFDGERDFGYKGDPDESYRVIVYEREIITNIGTLSISPPDKLVYKIGEELDMTGGRKSCAGAKVSNLNGTIAHWDDFGSDLTMFDIDSSDFDNSKPGEYTIRTDCYDLSPGSQKEFTVKVIDSEKPAGAETVISVADSVTGENIEGIKVTLYEDIKEFNKANRIIAMWNTSKNPERRYIETDFDKDRNYIVELENIPEDYCQYGTFEFGFNSADENTNLTINLLKEKQDPEPSEEEVQGPSAKISVVDMITGKNIEGVDVEIERGINGTGYFDGKWNTSDTAEKSYTPPVFDPRILYGVYIKNVPEEYDHFDCYIFSFGKKDEKADWTIRLVKRDTPKNITLSMYDWSSEDTFNFIDNYKPFYAKITNDEGVVFYEFNAIDECALPDGEYTFELIDPPEGYTIIEPTSDFAREIYDKYGINTVISGSKVNFTVKDGKPDKEIVFDIKNKNAVPVVEAESDMKFRVYGKYKGIINNAAEIGKAEIRNASDDVVETIELGKSFSLPDGEYSATLLLNSRAHSCFSDNRIKFTVKDGKTETKLFYNVEHWDFKDKGNGDSNGDGSVDLSDAVLIMQALANPSKYGVEGSDERHMTEEGYDRADVDGAGVTNMDALTIQKYLLGFYNVK